jgi:ABC-2 type transport system permease protein
MNQRRIKTIIGKEWQETIRNKTIVSTFLIPLILFTVMPLVIAFLLPRLLGAETLTNDNDAAQMTQLLAQVFPAFRELDAVGQFQVFILRQFLVFYLMTPIIGAMSIATYSIIGEKTSRSLEALLATPTRTDELLLAKSIAAALPAVLATWVCFGIFALAVRVLGGAQIASYTLDRAAWAMILLLTPLIALFGLGLGVIVSSRVNDPRSAQQIGGILVLPIIALMIGQTSGLFLLGLSFVLVGAVALVLLDLIVLVIGVNIFNREAILTRWR